jgi:hypothetical protein
MAIKTQGTNLFFINGSTVETLTCPTGITGLGGARDQIETTCLENTGDKTYVAGLGNPGEVSVPFVFDPTALDQRVLIGLKDTGADVEWLIGFSDGTTIPTVASGELVLATTRTGARFKAFVADVNIDVATNEIVRGTLTLQRSGLVEWTWKA